MKEKIYGWYPSIKNVYDERIGVPSSYHVECLYKFKGTMYETKPYRPGPDNLTVQGYAPKSRPSTAVKTPTFRSSNGQRPKTAPIPQYRPIKKLSIPTPLECWSKSVPDSEQTHVSTNHYTVQSPVRIPSAESNNFTPAIYTSGAPLDIIDSPHTKPPGQYDGKKDLNVSPRTRATSASIRRDCRSAPKRPVKSAGPVRQAITPAATPIVTPSVAPAPFTPQCPIQTPTSSKPHLDPPEVDLLDDNGNIVPNYDQEKERYGWGVEVHGNPFKYKKIPRRLPFTMKVKTPKVAQNPPRIHMETNETFFQNTIPRRPMAYTIHKDWVSEILHAKRVELQQRDGMKYRWKNFAFVY